MPSEESLFLTKIPRNYLGSILIQIHEMQPKTSKTFIVFYLRLGLSNICICFCICISWESKFSSRCRWRIEVRWKCPRQIIMLNQQSSRAPTAEQQSNVEPSEQNWTRTRRRNFVSLWLRFFFMVLFLVFVCVYISMFASTIKLNQQSRTENILLLTLELAFLLPFDMFFVLIFIYFVKRLKYWTTTAEQSLLSFLSLTFVFVLWYNLDWQSKTDLAFWQLNWIQCWQDGA